MGRPLDVGTSIKSLKYQTFDIYDIKETRKMRLLFATTNPAKVKKYAEELKKNNIELVTINDVGIKLKVDENGKNAVENAYIKAKAYYDATGIPTIGMDNNLYIEEIPEDKQPGTHVRRINGKELNDDEMIEYYTTLVRKYGGKLTAKWVYGMVLYNGEEAKEYNWSKSNFYFVDEPCKKRNPGYPLDSIAIVPEYNKYLVELTEEEKQQNNRKNHEEKVIEFIINNL